MSDFMKIKILLTNSLQTLMILSNLKIGKVLERKIYLRDFF